MNEKRKRKRGIEEGFECPVFCRFISIILYLSLLFYYILGFFNHSNITSLLVVGKRGCFVPSCIFCHHILTHKRKWNINLLHEVVDAVSSGFCEKSLLMLLMRNLFSSGFNFVKNPYWCCWCVIHLAMALILWKFLIDAIVLGKIWGIKAECLTVWSSNRR